MSSAVRAIAIPEKLSTDSERDSFSTDTDEGQTGWASRTAIAKILMFIGTLTLAGMIAFWLQCHINQKYRAAWVYQWVQHECKHAQLAEARLLAPKQKKADFDPAYLLETDLAYANWMPYYGSSDFEKEVPSNAKAAFIVLHGAQRNALDYFCIFQNLTTLAKKDDFIVIAPKFHYKVDVPGQNELWWNGSHPSGDWRAGSTSDMRSGASVSSFEVLDDLILKLSDAVKHPLMERISIVGHSAGAVTVQRYALLSHLRPRYLDPNSPDGRLFPTGVRQGIDVRYIVANPSSYAYTDKMRWIYQYFQENNSFSEPIYTAYSPGLGTSVDSESDYFSRPFNASRPFICSDVDFNSWNYGVDVESVFSNDPMTGYLKSHPHLQKGVEHYKDRDVVYLVGENDTCTQDMLGVACLSSCWTRLNRGRARCSSTLMDVTCPAMLQGAHRNMRGHLYMRHLREHYGHDVHRLHVVPGLGHQGAEMLLSDASVRSILNV